MHLVLVTNVSFAADFQNKLVQTIQLKFCKQILSNQFLIYFIVSGNVYSMITFLQFTFKKFFKLFTISILLSTADFR